MSGTGKRLTAPWKHTDKDRGWMRRKAAADARAAVHICGPTCKRNRVLPA